MKTRRARWAQVYGEKTWRAIGEWPAFHTPVAQA